MKSLLVITATSLICTVAYAQPSYFTQFKKMYPNSKTSNASCLICHVNQSDYERNPYGQDYENNNHNFKVIEGFDSDVDGFTNIAEIVAGTQPGNRDSHPPVPTPVPNPPGSFI